MKPPGSQPDRRRIRVRVKKPPGSQPDRRRIRVRVTAGLSAEPEEKPGQGHERLQRSSQNVEC